MKTAFLGLGIMGYQMAGHLASGGFNMQVYNRTQSVSKKWQEEYSGTSHASPSQAVSGAELIFMCLGNDDDVRSVFYGDEGILESLKPGVILVDHTTTSADLARELAQVCADKHVHFLDAPVSGGEIGAQQGILTVMVGGDAETLNKASKAISCYASQIQLMGKTGSGQLAKMVNQICIAGLLQGLSEGLHFAMEQKLDCEVLLSTISKGAAQSWQMENRGSTMVADKFDFGFAVKWMLKDLTFCLQEAERQSIDLPITRSVFERYQLIADHGHENFDTSSLITLLRNKDGIGKVS